MRKWLAKLAGRSVERVVADALGEAEQWAAGACAVEMEDGESVVRAFIGQITIWCVIPRPYSWAVAAEIALQARCSRCRKLEFISGVGGGRCSF